MPTAALLAGHDPRRRRPAHPTAHHRLASVAAGLPPALDLVGIPGDPIGGEVDPLRTFAFRLEAPQLALGEVDATLLQLFMAQKHRPLLSGNDRPWLRYGRYTSLVSIAEMFH